MGQPHFFIVLKSRSLLGPVQTVKVCCSVKNKHCAITLIVGNKFNNWTFSYLRLRETRPRPIKSLFTPTICITTSKAKKMFVLRNHKSNVYVYRLSCDSAEQRGTFFVFLSRVGEKRFCNT